MTRYESWRPEETHTRDEMLDRVNEAVKKAVREERRRCFKIADAHVGRGPFAFGDDVARLIAREIHPKWKISDE